MIPENLAFGTANFENTICKTFTPDPDMVAYNKRLAELTDKEKAEVEVAAVKHDKQLARTMLDIYERHLVAGIDPETARFLSLSIIDAEIEETHR